MDGRATRSTTSASSCCWVREGDDWGWDRIHRALDTGDPHDEVQDAWVAKEKVRDVYLTDDPVHAAELLDDAIAWCVAAEAGPELCRLAKTLRRWHHQIVAHHHTAASNGPVEAANLTIKQVKRSGRGFRNFANYRPPDLARRRPRPRGSTRHETPSPTQVVHVGRAYCSGPISSGVPEQMARIKSRPTEMATSTSREIPPARCPAHPRATLAAGMRMLRSTVAAGLCNGSINSAARPLTPRTA